MSSNSEEKSCMSGPPLKKQCSGRSVVNPVDLRVGVLGGGQLGRMMAYAAGRLGIHLIPLDPLGQSSPTGVVTAESVKGHFNQEDKVLELSKLCSILTVEIEHINTDALYKLEQKGNVSVQPSANTLSTIQDKLIQKEHLRKHGFPLADFDGVSSEADIKDMGIKFGYPMMLKSRKLAYDGKGNAVVKDENSISEAFASLGGQKEGGPELYVEKWCPFVKELAVMVARSTTGELACYPVVETTQKDSICHTVVAPAPISRDLCAATTKIAKESVATFDGAGVFGVELFLTDDNQILLNEIAPRPHNSGHYTIEACSCDQFEQHLRAIIGLPLGDTSLRVGAAQMINILGDGGNDSTMKQSGANACFAVPGASLHWYGKGECRKGRKVGHITITADNETTLKERVKLLQDKISGADSANI